MSRYERYNHDEMPHAQPPLLRVESSGWRPIGRQSIFLKSNEFYHRSPQLGVISHDQLGRHSRGRLAAPRRAPGEDAPAARDDRASLRDHQGLDGINPLPDEDAQIGCHRNGLAFAGLQPEARREHHRHRPADRSDEGLGAPASQITPRPAKTPLTTPPARRKAGMSRGNRQNRKTRLDRLSKHKDALHRKYSKRFYTAWAPSGHRPNPQNFPCPTRTRPG